MRSIAYAVTIATALVACGDDSVHHLADAPPIGDDGTPIQPDAPAPVKVTVNLRIHGVAMAGIKVYFQGPDSAELAAIDTDTAGSAAAEMPNGGSVTVLDPAGYALPTAFGGPPPHHVKTWMGVKPGDVLYLDESVQDVPPGTTWQLTLPTDPTISSYLVTAGCESEPHFVSNGSGGVFDAVQIPALCPPGVTTSGVMVTSSSGSGDPQQGGYMANVTLDSTTPVSMTLAPFTTHLLKYSNIGDQYDQLAGSLTHVTTDGVFRDSALDTFSYGLVNHAVDGSHQAIDIPGSVLVETLFPDSISYLGYDQMIVRWGSVEPIDSDLSLATIFGFTDAPVFDATTRHVTFAVNASGSMPDGSIISIDDYHVDQVSGQTTYTLWDIVTPFALDTTVPTLPAALALYQPQSVDEPGVFVTNAKVTGGYDLLRSRAFQIDPYSVRTLAGIGGVAQGTLTISNFVSPPLAKPTRAPGYRHGWRPLLRH